MTYKYSNACNRYGASMGRSNDNPANFEGLRVHLVRVNLDSGGYDPGGAYWGYGKPLFLCYTNDQDSDDVQYFLRADSRDHAKDQILEMVDCRFYH